jgi:hypothetical protein
MVVLSGLGSCQKHSASTVTGSNFLFLGEVFLSFNTPFPSVFATSFSVFLEVLCHEILVFASNSKERVYAD